jgi:opacity protein-like surface antigen
MGRKLSAGVIFSFIIVTFLSAGAVYAQGPSIGYKKMNYVSVKGGIYSPTNDLDDFKTGFNGEITLNRYLSPYFALDATVGYFHTNNSENGIFLTSLPDEGIISPIAFSGDFDINAVPVTATAKGILPLDFGELYAGVGTGVYFVGGDLDVNVSDVVKISSSDTDTVWGMQLLAGVLFDINDTFFVGIEGKYILTGGVELEDEIYGIKVEYPDFDLDGYTVSALLGFRF